MACIASLAVVAATTVFATPERWRLGMPTNPEVDRREQEKLLSKSCGINDQDASAELRSLPTRMRVYALMRLN